MIYLRQNRILIFQNSFGRGLHALKVDHFYCIVSKFIYSSKGPTSNLLGQLVVVWHLRWVLPRIPNDIIIGQYCTYVGGNGVEIETLLVGLDHKGYHLRGRFR